MHAPPYEDKYVCLALPNLVIFLLLALVASPVADTTAPDCV